MTGPTPFRQKTYKINLLNEILIVYFLGDTAQGLSHYKVAKAMNIIGPLSTLGVVVFIIVYYVAIIGAAVARYG